MFELILRQMQNAARAGRLYLTEHATDEMAADRLRYDDVLNCLLTGEIVDEQFDEEWGENKYVIYGDSLDQAEMALVAKYSYNRNTVIITVYRLRITDYD